MLKFRWVKPVVGMVLLAGTAVVVTDQFSAFEIRRLKGRIDELESEKARLALFAERLSASRRVAQLDVLEQTPSNDGPVTVMRWQQIGPDGRLAAPELITIQGRQVYLEAMVVKFRHELIGAGDDSERKVNLAVFRRAFGERQAPVTGHPLDQTAPTIDATQGSDAKASAEEQELWRQFLTLIEDPALADRYGVRVAQYEAPSVLVRPGQTWEVTLDAAGGLNLRKLADGREPQRAGSIYQ